MNKRGADYANVTLPFGSDSEISHIKAKTLRPDGRIVRLNQNQVFEINLFPDFIFYSDVRAKRFSMPAVETGCILEYEWTQRLPPQANIPRWNFQMQEPVLQSSITVICPRELSFHFAIHDQGIPVSAQTDPYRQYIKYQWNAANIPPLVTETAMPPMEPQTSHILFSTTNFQSWKDAGNYFVRLSGDRFKADDSIHRMVRNLTENLTNQKEQLKNIFEYIRNSIRYIAIEIGIGGYQPHSASRVFLNKYGDCKDMTGLLIAMASAAGIEVSPVLLSNWYHGRIDTSVVNISQFNHVIALATLSDGTEIWMDPTEKYEAFGNLPWYDQNTLALKAGTDPVLQNTPVDSIGRNLSTRFWSVDLYEDGQATGTVELRFTGAHAIELRRQLSGIRAQEITAWFGQELLTLFPVSKYYVIQIAHINNLERPLTINSGFITNKIAFQNDDVLSLYPGSFSAFNWPRLFPNQDRQHPVVLRHPVSTRDEILIRYPQSWEYLTGSVSDSLRTPFGHYSWSIDQSEHGTIHFKRSFDIRRSVISPSDYTEFVRFLSSVSSGDQTLIQFKQSQ
ncbi:DUF3857 domain-containing protein [bacterium]|nr:DUF3857 domain-containing protein [bacterium]